MDDLDDLCRELTRALEDACKSLETANRTVKALREDAEDGAHDAELIAELHQKIDRLSADRHLDPGKLAPLVHELIRDFQRRDLNPWDMPWKVASSEWRRQLLRLISEFLGD